MYEKYVAHLRIVKGEAPALRNALILMHAYLGTQPFRSIEQRHALLGISFVAIDLAAQINDYRSLFRLAKTLSDIAHEGFSTFAERAILNRLVADTRSRANRYSPEFDHSYRVRNEAEALALTAVEEVDLAVESIGELAYSWPEVTEAWLGSYFGLLNYGINVGWTPIKLMEMFKRHDDLAVKLEMLFGANATLLTELAGKNTAGNPYSAEFLATLAITRENPAHNLSPRSETFKSLFDADKALAIIHQAIAEIDPSNHYGDTIIGGLRLARAEALLCKSGRRLSPSQRDEYEIARFDAVQMFEELGMPRKILRLDRLELRAGIIRSPMLPKLRQSQ